MSYAEIIGKNLISALIAFVVTLVATPVAIALARRLDIMDRPDAVLKPHARPTPYLGGVAIAAGWLVANVVAMAFTGFHANGLIVLAGGVGMMIVGLLDDVADLSPKVRLAIGAVIIGAVIASTGIGLRLAGAISGALHIPLHPAAATTLSFALGVLVVLGTCNSSNLLDGLDGLCSGVTAIISLGMFLLAAYLATWRTDEPQHTVRLALAAGMLGATLGFLPMNFNPAKIFMGDAGSVLLGYNCGMMILLFAEWANFRWVLAAMIISALPVFDTALAMYRRWKSGRPIFQGDRSHFYDQLVQRGCTVRQAVLICYGLAMVYTAIGLGLTLIPMRYGIPVAIVVVLATAFAARAAGMTNPPPTTAGGNPEKQASNGVAANG